jgi:hypothetical protein
LLIFTPHLLWFDTASALRIFISTDRKCWLDKNVRALKKFHALGRFFMIAECKPEQNKGDDHERRHAAKDECASTGAQNRPDALLLHFGPRRTSVASLQQVDLCAALHLALDDLEPCALTFGLAVRAFC